MDEETERKVGYLLALVSSALIIKRYIRTASAATPGKYTCTGSPNYQCIEGINGQYNTLLECQNACITPSVNIVATNMILDKTTCQEPCTVNISITWKNNGTTSGTFTPGVKINEALITLLPVTLAPGISVTKQFQKTGIMLGSYNICPDPNP